MAIQKDETQVYSYRNGYIRGVCRSPECVAVTWHTGFAQSVKAETWDNAEFLEKPEAARLVNGEELERALGHFDRRVPYATPVTTASTRRPRP